MSWQIVSISLFFRAHKSRLYYYSATSTSTVLSQYIYCSISTTFRAFQRQFYDHVALYMWCLIYCGPSLHAKVHNSTHQGAKSATSKSCPFSFLLGNTPWVHNNNDNLTILKLNLPFPKFYYIRFYHRCYLYNFWHLQNLAT